MIIMINLSGCLLTGLLLNGLGNVGLGVSQAVDDDFSQ